MKVLFTHRPTGLKIMVTNTNEMHKIPTIDCQNELVKTALTDNLKSFLSSYVFRNEIAIAKLQYKELFTESDNESDAIFSVQVNLDRYITDFFIPNMTAMDYVHEIVST